MVRSLADRTFQLRWPPWEALAVANALPITAPKGPLGFNKELQVMV